MQARFLFPTILLLLFLKPAQAQELSQVTFSSGANLVYFSIKTEQGILLRITAEGNLIEWGTEVKALRGDYYAPQLQPFTGRIDYYGVEGDSISKGRIKMIGTCAISYYNAFSDETHVGKVRSVGRIFLDYYNPYDNKAVRGKLKMIGNLRLEYYNEFENEAYRGKLRSIGGTQLTYYSAFDDRNNSGKVKSIGGVKYAWYSSFDRRDMGGALKTGYYRQAVNGITYILW
ncbi:MAG TPA: hypothetical protein VFZ42_00090 [Chitinophagaceae bacterium]